jgi:putative ABC transport system permease protein
MWTVRPLGNFSQDLLYAVRTMRKNRVFVGTAVLTLAIAIGGNTAMFAIVRTVLLKPLQYHNSDKLVRISGGATPIRFTEMQTGARSFAELGAYTSGENVTLSDIGEPEVLRSVHISANFLKILGVSPIVGRGFRPEEDSSGGAPVVMISAELWERRFGANPNRVGRTATLDAAPYTIIGVLPPRFQFPLPGVDIWMTAPSHLQTIPPKSRALSPFLTVFGRLMPGLSLEKANAEMRVIRRQYAMAHPTMLDAKPKTPIEVTPVQDVLVANVRSMLWMLFGTVGFVLIIACANLASLLLTRANAREREFAVRSALGAPRSRLVGQLLSESVLLSVDSWRRSWCFPCNSVLADRS